MDADITLFNKVIEAIRARRAGAEKAGAEKAGAEIAGAEKAGAEIAGAESIASKDAGAASIAGKDAAASDGTIDLTADTPDAPKEAVDAPKKVVDDKTHEETGAGTKPQPQLDRRQKIQNSLDAVWGKTGAGGANPVKLSENPAFYIPEELKRWSQKRIEEWEGDESKKKAIKLVLAEFERYTVNENMRRILWKEWSNP